MGGRGCVWNDFALIDKKLQYDFGDGLVEKPPRENIAERGQETEKWVDEAVGRSCKGDPFPTSVG